MADSRTWSYRDAGGTAAWAQRLLWTDSALSGLAALLALARNFDPYRAGNVELALALAQLGAWLTGFALALRWLYLANANARALGATDLMGWPGLAVGWFFIPLANLFMPYMTLRDMWRASVNPRDWQAAGAPAAILVWWVCWLAAGITATIAFRLQIEFRHEAGEAMEIFYFISNCVSIPAALLFAWLIGRIQAMQERIRLTETLA